MLWHCSAQLNTERGRRELRPPLPSTNLFVRRTRRLTPQPTGLPKPTASRGSTVGSIRPSKLPITSARAILTAVTCSQLHAQPQRGGWEAGDKTQDARVHPSDRVRPRSKFCGRCGAGGGGIQGPGAGQAPRPQQLPTGGPGRALPPRTPCLSPGTARPAGNPVSKGGAARSDPR